MTTHDESKRGADRHPVDAESTSETNTPSRTRRRLVKTGIAAIPVIVTLKALPVRAGGGGMDSLGDYDYNDRQGDDQDGDFDGDDSLSHSDDNRDFNSR